MTLSQAKDFLRFYNLYCRVKYEYHNANNFCEALQNLISMTDSIKSKYPFLDLRTVTNSHKSFKQYNFNLYKTYLRG